MQHKNRLFNSGWIFLRLIFAKGIKKMKHNQSTRHNKHTRESLAALNNIRAVLASASKSKQLMLPENENQGLTVRRVAMNPPEQISEAILHKLLLSKDQCDDLWMLQDLCKVINKAVQQINMVSANHGLRLPQLYFFELTDYLMRIDVLIRAAKTAAKRLGVEAVQPKVNTDYVYRVLQKDKLSERVKAHRAN